jgi:hypothetical protein
MQHSHMNSHTRQSRDQHSDSDASCAKRISISEGKARVPNFPPSRSILFEPITQEQPRHSRKTDTFLIVFLSAADIFLKDPSELVSEFFSVIMVLPSRAIHVAEDIL